MPRWGIERTRADYVRLPLNPKRDASVNIFLTATHALSGHRDAHVLPKSPSR